MSACRVFDAHPQEFLSRRSGCYANSMTVAVGCLLDIANSIRILYADRLPLIIFVSDN